MSSPAPLPGLEGLSSQEKDDLILGLWKEVASERAASQALRARLAELEDPLGETGAPRPLRAALQEAGAAARAPVPARVTVRLGRGLGLLRSRAVLVVLILVGLAFMADHGVAWYQERALAQKRQGELRLRHAAFTSLYVELARVAYEPDGKSYRLTMTMRNVDPQGPVYVMLSPMRVFEQAGLAWKEVPARAPEGASWGVVKLTDRYTFETIFEPNLDDWAELIPGYMHVRFENNMLISQRSEPTDDIVERKDPFYVYLKPHGVDDKAPPYSRYPGTVPVYIPMPPH